MEAKPHLAKQCGRQLIRVSVLLFLSLAGVRSSSGYDEWLRGLDLEPALGQASLVLVGRVVDVRETRILVGGKAETTLQQFKFAPVQVLKGVFSPEQGLDIQNYRDSAPIGRGQLRLLMLGRSRQGNAPFRSSPGLKQAIPPLHDPNDELVETCKLLLAVNATPERRRKVVLLLNGLRA